MVNQGLLKNKIDEYFKEALIVLTDSSNLADKIGVAARMVITSLQAGGTVYWCGNGGSAADSQHLAAELVGKFKINRPPLRSLALTTDTSILTATGNDFGYEFIFSRQIEAFGKANDLLVGISTSGKSTNVINALKAGRKLGVATIVMTGSIPNEMWNLSDLYLNVPSSDTSHIQEIHILLGQLICGIAEDYIFSDSSDAHS